MANQFVKGIMGQIGVNQSEALQALPEHPIRRQYPDLVGSHGITNVVKQNWRIYDLIPISFITIFFTSLIWWFGHYKPAQYIAALNENIETLSSAFDDRAESVLSASAEYRQFLSENNLPEPAIKWIDELRQSVSTLTKEKPSEVTIKKRFDAEAKFNELARQITANRDLSIYGQLNPMPEGFTDRQLIARGRETISTAESWLDVLTPIEEEAKVLLGEFLDKPMPKREGELRRFILEEWKAKHLKLLEYWKSFKAQELHWKDFLLARQAREKDQAAHQARIDQQRIELETKIKANQAAIDAERTKSKGSQEKVIKRRARPKSITQSQLKQKPSELERRKKAAEMLLD